MFKKKVLIEMGLYDQKLIFPEYDLLLKLIRKGCKNYYIEKPLYEYKRRENSITSKSATIEKGIKELEEKWGTKINIRDY